MTSGTFAYPLCFSAMLAAIGLFVSNTKPIPATSAEERAAYQEIVNLYNDESFAGIREKCDRFMALYPDSRGADAVAMIFGESLVKSGNWEEVGPYCRGLEARFPKSENLDRYVLFQAFALFQQGNFTEVKPLLEKFLKRFPNSPLMESALYYVAMSNFLSNNYKETLPACRDYLAKYPDGNYAADMHYRLAFIDFNDKEEDKSAKIIRDLGNFLKEHPNDAANGSMYCLMADTYKRMEKPDDALAAYNKAIETNSPDDVHQYAIDSATAILQERKDWSGIAKLHGDFMLRNPDSQLALLSASWVTKMMVREGKDPETAELLAKILKIRIADPSREQVELIIDELVKTLVHRKKSKDIDIEAADTELTAILEKIATGQENITTAARICYARARLAELLRRKDLSDLYLKSIAISNAKDPSALSPALLAVCGDILLKLGDIDGAEAMFKRLTDHFPKTKFGRDGSAGLERVARARNTSDNEITVENLEALVDLDQLETAEKLATEITGDRKFRGEAAGKAYLLLARIYRKQAAKAEGEKARDLMKSALGNYQRVYVAYQSFPDLCAEGYWQASEVAKELGDEELRQEILRNLLSHPKLKNTERHKQAEKEK